MHALEIAAQRTAQPIAVADLHPTAVAGNLRLRDDFKEREVK
jgi:hypothetical protein